MGKIKRRKGKEMCHPLKEEKEGVTLLTRKSLAKKRGCHAKKE